MQNFMKTIISAVQTWTKGEIKDSTADWNENDSGADSYVKNRTHWEEMKLITLLPEMTVVIEEDGEGYVELSSNITQLTIGQEYHITLNGVEYACVAREWNEDDSVKSLIGNGTIYGDGNEGNGEPFSCDSYEDGYIYLNAAVGEYTISISTSETVVHKLDSKYLPTNLATTDDVDSAIDVAYAAQTTADSAQTTADSAQTTADSKMNATNPVGTGSFSMNREADMTVGDYSAAIGYSVVAPNKCVNVYGMYNIYDKDTYGFELANFTNNQRINNMNSFVKSSGYTFDSTTGKFALVESESKNTYPYYTVCSKSWDTTSSDLYLVIGKGNLGDSSYKTYVYESGLLSTVRGKYAHIVGNGTSETIRSNAHTLDWDGVGWYQGGLQVGGNAQDDGAKNVLLEGDAIPVPTSATVGQTIVVKSVDENGQPTEWEAVDPMVITSSTEGSNKKFKITVDDTGTLTIKEMIEQRGDINE